MSTALEVAGVAAIATGVFLVSIPVGLIVSGVFLVIGGAAL